MLNWGTMALYYHLSASIDGILEGKLYHGICNKDGTQMAEDDIVLSLKEMQRTGGKFIPARGCDNFDPQSGCLGHEEEEGLNA